jgi:hypothetical protein
VRCSALLVTMAALVIGLAGCSSQTPGDATPGDGSETGGLPSFSEDPGASEEPTEGARPRGIGLRNIRERIEHLGGNLTVRSRRGQTAVTASLPLVKIRHA